MLRGKLAFVTGAGSGIGKATCEVLAKEGVRILAADWNVKSVENTLQNIRGDDHKCFELDVSDFDKVTQTIEKVKEVCGSVPSLVVNSAGVTRDSFLMAMTPRAFQEVIDVNLKGTFAVTQVVCKELIEAKQGGSIVNLASIVGQTGNMGQANYAASKAGVEGFTKSVAKEMGKHGIRCNAVVPGFIESPMTAAVPEKVRDLFRTRIPLSRLGLPYEVAEVIAFLLSDKSSYVTGASIQVTGGL